MLQEKIKTKEQEAKEFLDYISSLETTFKTASNGWQIVLKNTSRAKSHLLRSSQFRIKNKSARNRHYGYILDLKNLISQAVYSHSKPNTKPHIKKNVSMYHYFIVSKTINNKNYDIILNTEEYFSDMQNTVKVVHLYDITEYKVKSSQSANGNVC